MTEEYLRTRNRMVTPYASPIESELPPDTRGVINEFGYRLYVRSVERGVTVTSLPKDFVETCFVNTVEYVRNLTDGLSVTSLPSLAESAEESMRLANNINAFFQHAIVRTKYRIKKVLVAPFFKGCGWLDECVGDFLSANLLIEVKAGERSFRNIDIRQVLIYCALNFASKTYDIANICLVNPRLGIFLGEPLERLCQEISGRSATDVLEEIVQFVSDPLDRYTIGWS